MKQLGPECIFNRLDIKHRMKNPEQKTQIKHKCFNGTIYKKEKQFWFLIRLTAATIKQVHWRLGVTTKETNWTAVA